jgi:DNA-binding MarR family transcriptional regulator
MATITKEDILEVLSGKIFGKIQLPLHRAFAQAGIALSLDQFFVMSCVGSHNNLTQHDLCELTHKEKPNMTRLIDKLETRQLVRRTFDEADRRVRHIMLTPAGHKLCEQAARVLTDVMNRALGNVEEEQLATCKSVIRSINENLTGCYH